MKFTPKEVQEIANKIGFKGDMKEFSDGLMDEFSEHKDVINNDPIKAGRIAKEHLDINPKYYSIIEKALGETKVKSVPKKEVSKKGNKR